MIISRKYRYLFIENANTASTAIAAELCRSYSGEEVLWKHATYYEFSRAAGPDEKKYFIFAGIRHPMSIVVSRYFKFLTDHDKRISASADLRIRHHLGRKQLQKFRFIAEHNASFSNYFAAFCRTVYNDHPSLLPRHIDYVIRYEQLEEDFTKVLQLLGVRQVHDLPPVNRTALRNADFSEYYQPEP